MNGGNAGDFDGGCRVRRCHLNGKNAGADKQRKMGEKVAEIEFFEVGNHAGNGHLSADKVTKCSDKVFVFIKQPLTSLIDTRNHPFLSCHLAMRGCPW